MAEFAIMGLILGGTALSAHSQYQQGKEQRELYKQRAAVAEEEARAVGKATDYKSRERIKQGRRDVARANVLFAKANVEPKTGTAALVPREIEDEYFRDAAFIQEGGAVEASRLRSEAAIERRMGRSAYSAGKWGAASTAMTGLGTAGIFGYKAGMFKKKPITTRTAKATYLRY